MAIGDSFASGEGNPDVEAIVHYEVPPVSTPGLVLPVRVVDRFPVWTDKQCHRSKAAWPAQLARSLEDATTTVTFLNLACSGAELAHLHSLAYSGIDRGNDDKLKPQLEVLREILQPSGSTAPRRVDALVVGAGLNDLEMTDRLIRCAKFYKNCRFDSMTAFLEALPDKYDALDAAIDSKLEVARTYFAGYPSRLFTDRNDDVAVCNPFDIAGGMSQKDANWLMARGADLNALISDAVAKHNTRTSENPWTFIPTTDRFRHHGYCAGEASRWFRSYQESNRIQLDVNGTVHPNVVGHYNVSYRFREPVKQGWAPACPTSPCIG